MSHRNVRLSDSMNSSAGAAVATPNRRSSRAAGAAAAKKLMCQQFKEPELSSDSGEIDMEDTSSDDGDRSSDYSGDSSSDYSSEDGGSYADSQQTSSAPADDDHDTDMTDVTSTETPPQQRQQQCKRAGSSIGQRSCKKLKQPMKSPHNASAAAQVSPKGEAAAAGPSNRATSIQTAEVQPGIFKITPGVKVYQSCYLDMPATIASRLCSEVSVSLTVDGKATGAQVTAQLSLRAPPPPPAAAAAAARQSSRRGRLNGMSELLQGHVGRRVTGIQVTNNGGSVALSIITAESSADVAAEPAAAATATAADTTEQEETAAAEAEADAEETAATADETADTQNGAGSLAKQQQRSLLTSAAPILEQPPSTAVAEAAEEEAAPQADASDHVAAEAYAPEYSALELCEDRAAAEAAAQATGSDPDTAGIDHDVAVAANMATNSAALPPPQLAAAAAVGSAPKDGNHNTAAAIVDTTCSGPPPEPPSGGPPPAAATQETDAEADTARDDHVLAQPDELAAGGGALDSAEGVASDLDYEWVEAPGNGRKLHNNLTAKGCPTGRSIYPPQKLVNKMLGAKSGLPRPFKLHTTLFKDGLQMGPNLVCSLNKPNKMTLSKHTVESVLDCTIYKYRAKAPNFFEVYFVSNTSNAAGTFSQQPPTGPHVAASSGSTQVPAVAAKEPASVTAVAAPAGPKRGPSRTAATAAVTAAATADEGDQLATIQHTTSHPSSSSHAVLVPTQAAAAANPAPAVPAVPAVRLPPQAAAPGHQPTQLGSASTVAPAPASLESAVPEGAQLPDDYGMMPYECVAQAVMELIPLLRFMNAPKEASTMLRAALAALKQLEEADRRDRRVVMFKAQYALLAMFVEHKDINEVWSALSELLKNAATMPIGA